MGDGLYIWFMYINIYIYLNKHMYILLVFFLLSSEDNCQCFVAVTRMVIFTTKIDLMDKSLKIKRYQL